MKTKNAICDNKKSRLQCLLLSILFLLGVSCNSNNKGAQTTEYNKSIENEVEQDSIPITVVFNEKGETGFNITDKYHFAYYESFVNPLEKTDTIKRKIFSPHLKQIFYFGNITLLDGNYKLVKRGLLVNKKHSKVQVNYINGEINLLENEVEVFDLTNIYSSYGAVISKQQKDNDEIIKKLDSVYLNLASRFTDSKPLLEVNKLFYYSNLCKIQPFSDKVEHYILNLKESISSVTFNGLLVCYVKNKIDSFDYAKLNERIYPKEYLENVSIGLFNFLRYEDYKGDMKYQPAVDWLKTTELYKNDSIYIKKEIAPFDNNSFKSNIKNLTLTDTIDRKTSLKQIIKENPSSYYLIDFWATWCAPCIKGIKTMKKMKLPKNVKVISISVDKEKDKQKWIKMTNKLEQSITYWLDETNDNTKEFMKFIEMQSVPRYILIDKNMNLIDQAFYHPQEPQFLSKLQDVKNHKYW